MRSERSLLLACMLGISTLSAQSSDLSQKANDPTAPLMSVQLIDEYTSDFHNGLEGESANSVLFRVAYPYKWGEYSHIVRMTQPSVTDSPTGDTGLANMTLFDMAVFDASWGRYGLGIVGSIPIADGNKQWSVGPAFGFVNNTLSKGLNLGLFTQNLFRISGDDERPATKISSLQPIINYSLGGGWNVGTGDIQYIYDWESTQWVSLPIGIQVGKLHRFGKLPVIFSIQYMHNFANEVEVDNGFFAPTAKNTLTFTAKFILPTF